MARFTPKAAAMYDTRILSLVPGYALLQELVPALLGAAAPDEASILVSGAGTGGEIMALARQRPRWRFAAVDPAQPMLDVARERAAACGVADRISYHAVPLADYVAPSPHDAATSLLVAQFLPDDGAKATYFAALHRSLVDTAPLIIADLTARGADMALAAYRRWAILAGQSEKQSDTMLAHISSSFHPIDEGRLRDLLADLGFDPPQPFFRALDYCGYVTRRRRST